MNRQQEKAMWAKQKSFVRPHPDIQLEKNRYFVISGGHGTGAKHVFDDKSQAIEHKKLMQKIFGGNVQVTNYESGHKRIAGVGKIRKGERRKSSLGAHQPRYQTSVYHTTYDENGNKVQINGRINPHADLKNFNLKFLEK